MLGFLWVQSPSSCDARPLPAAASLGVAQALGRVGSAVALAGSGAQAQQLWRRGSLSWSVACGIPRTRDRTRGSSLAGGVYIAEPRGA